jgi:hypothetical protein
MMRSSWWRASTSKQGWARAGLVQSMLYGGCTVGLNLLLVHELEW